VSHNNDVSVPLHRVALLRPFTEFLSDVGTPIERGLCQAGLPSNALEDLNNYIPSHRYYDFLINMAHSQGIPNLGFHVGQRFGANTADPHLTEMLRQAPSIYQGLTKASEFVNKTVSNCQLGLVTPADGRYTYFYHSPSCNVRNPVIQQIGWFGVMSLLGMVRACLGPHWQPDEIGLMTGHIPCHEIRDQFPDTHIKLLQPYSYIRLDTAILAQVPLQPNAAADVSSQLIINGLPKDFHGSLSKVLHSYIHESDLNIEFAASLCDMSKRSLQRKLAASGTHYSELVDSVRFESACNMLHDPDVKITDIAHTLGYSDTSHFSRAFRRIAGISPRQYRRHYQH
jgi:AraC-like DNA-binding protein